MAVEKKPAQASAEPVKSAQSNQNQATPQIDQAQLLQEQLAKQLLPFQEAVRSQQVTIEQLQMQLQQQSEQSRKVVVEEKNKGVKDIMAMYEDDEASEDKYEQLTNRQMIDVITKSVDKAISNQKSAAMFMIDDAVKADREKVTRLEKATISLLSGLAAQQVRGKYSDFGNYEKDIPSIQQNYPGISIEDAYHLAKSRKTSDLPGKGNMDTEKPESFATSRGSESRRSTTDDYAEIASRGRRSAPKGDEQSSASGIVGFRSFLDEAIDSVLGNE